jgi:3-deoxy-D-manno-octulosonic-acid transferase
VGRRLQPRCLFIAEMGLLAELYSVADWVYVGGGFGKGVHNTMEPAIYGVPIAIGPKGQNGFSEIEELKKQKQLTVVRDSVMLDFWLQNINKHTSQDRKYWKENALILRGGTKKIDSLLSLVTRNV